MCSVSTFRIRLLREKVPLTGSFHGTEDEKKMSHSFYAGKFCSCLFQLMQVYITFIHFRNILRDGIFIGLKVKILEK